MRLSFKVGHRYTRVSWTICGYETPLVGSRGSKQIGCKHFLIFFYDQTLRHFVLFWLQSRPAAFKTVTVITSRWHYNVLTHLQLVHFGVQMHWLSLHFAQTVFASLPGLHMPESVKVTVLQVDSFRHTNKHGLANCCLLLVKLKSLHYRYAICCQYEFVCIKKKNITIRCWIIKKVGWWFTWYTCFCIRRQCNVGPSDPDGSISAESLAGFTLTLDAVTYQLFTLEEITKEAIFLSFVRSSCCNFHFVSMLSSTYMHFTDPNASLFCFVF